MIEKPLLLIEQCRQRYLELCPVQSVRKKFQLLDPIYWSRGKYGKVSIFISNSRKGLQLR